MLAERKEINKLLATSVIGHDSETMDRGKGITFLSHRFLHLFICRNRFVYFTRASFRLDQSEVVMSNFSDSPDMGDSPDRPSGLPSSTNLSSSSSATVDSEETALSKYEHELERMMNESLVNGQDVYTQKLFIAFQNAAKAVTKMFRGRTFTSPASLAFTAALSPLERSNGTANWNTFHAAAGSVTMLYKGRTLSLSLSIPSVVSVLRKSRRSERRHSTGHHPW